MKFGLVRICGFRVAEQLLRAAAALFYLNIYMLNWSAHFDRIVCLTMGGHEWDIGKAEFDSVGINAQKFIALEDIGPHQSFNTSTYKILKDFYDSDNNTLLFLEDDCDFRNLSHLTSALKELPDQFDILYLGGNIREDKPERYSRYLYKAKNIWTTHCVAYRKPIVKFILENHPDKSEQMFDNWLANNLSQFNGFIVAPMVAYQRPRTSAYLIL